ncbi:GNAT family protein [Flaviaesturariibacter amylovorans]|uniref:GNAT family protein n=1 Tax=Flaviaesturariibacter amylovorans TaxID=1084520 RepID=A0ABP8GH99_9BACT
MNAPFPEFETERFRLCRIMPADQPSVFAGLSHPEVIPFYGVRYETLEATAAQMDFYERIWQEGSGGWWKIVRRADDAFAGAIGFNHYQPAHRKAEIGYWLLPPFWKQGILPEVAPVLLRYLRYERNIHRIEALVEAGNDASGRVLERLGFTCEGLLRDWEIKEGRAISFRCWSLLATDNALFWGHEDRHHQRSEPEPARQA